MWSTYAHVAVFAVPCPPTCVVRSADPYGAVLAVLTPVLCGSFDHLSTEEKIQRNKEIEEARIHEEEELRKEMEKMKLEGVSQKHSLKRQEGVGCRRNIVFLAVTQSSSASKVSVFHHSILIDLHLFAFSSLFFRAFLLLLCISSSSFRFMCFGKAGVVSLCNVGATMSCLRIFLHESNARD